MSTHTFGLFGTISFWLGVVICVAALILAVWASMGFSDADLNRGHDTYYILLSWKSRMSLLLPLVAGGILIVTGLQIRRQVVNVEAGLKRVSDNWRP